MEKRFPAAEVRSVYEQKLTEVQAKFAAQLGTRAELEAIFDEVARRVLPDLYPPPPPVPAPAPGPDPATRVARRGRT